MRLKFLEPDKKPKLSKREIRLMRRAFKLGVHTGFEILNDYEDKDYRRLARTRFNELLKTIK